MSDLIKNLIDLKNKNKISNTETSQYINNYARLLAAENLDIVRENITTAYIDIEKRVVHIPSYSSINAEIDELFFTHEISHALFTPKDSYPDEIRQKENSALLAQILNIVEDARVEKLIKRKYPGLVPIHKQAYKDLTVAGFFGDFDETLLNFLDKVNIKFKIGTKFKFNEYEEKLIVNIATCETFEHVREVSYLIYEYLKSAYEKQAEENDNQDDENSAEESSSMPSSKLTDTEDSGESNLDDGLLIIEMDSKDLDNSNSDINPDSNSEKNENSSNSSFMMDDIHKPNQKYDAPPEWEEKEISKTNEQEEKSIKRILVNFKPDLKDKELLLKISFNLKDIPSFSNKKSSYKDITDSLYDTKYIDENDNEDEEYYNDDY